MFLYVQEWKTKTQIFSSPSDLYPTADSLVNYPKKKEEEELYLSVKLKKGKSSKLTTCSNTVNYSWK